MTEGIIQKVFQKYYNEYIYLDDMVEIHDMEKELIAEIKKEFDNELDWEGYRAYDKDYLKAVENWKKALIGDNQE
jgi:hypothetical protein